MDGKNNRGSALTMVLIISGLVSIFSYVVFSFLQSQRSGTEEELRQLQAKMLASDILELGKYFVFYERVVFIDDPLSMSSSRLKTIQDFAHQSYGSLEANNSFLINACGGYDANAVEVGILKADGSPTFCPLYLRNPLMDGEMFENMLLNMWSYSGEVGHLVSAANGFETEIQKRKAILRRDSSGAYVFTIDLKNTLLATDNQMIRLHLDQNIVQTLKSQGFDAKLTYKLYGPSSGFKTRSNERYITVQSEVRFGDALFKKAASLSESLILYTTTVKDFAIFLMYPENSAGARTTRFSQALKLGGPSSRINGRVFFNGDLDTPLADLPVFNEMVMISGDLILNAGDKFEDVRALLKEKFKKGLVVRFPVERLINDGECLPGLIMANTSGMYCKHPKNLTARYNIADYIDNLGNICSPFKVAISSGSYGYATGGSKDAIVKEQCKGSSAGKVFLSGGVHNVTVAGSHAYIVSPIRSLVVAAGANIYGTIFGGYLEAGAGAKFYSLAAIRKGLPGIAGESDLVAISGEAEQLLAGVGVPLTNVPLVRKATVGK